MIATTIEATATAPVATATAALRRSTASVKEARKKKSKAVKQESTLAKDIFAAVSCTLPLIGADAKKAEPGYKLFGSQERPSMVVRLPKWNDFQATLPAGEEGKELAQCFFALRSAVEVLAGESTSTWVIHQSGSFALYSRFAK